MAIPKELVYCILAQAIIVCINYISVQTDTMLSSTYISASFEKPRCKMWKPQAKKTLTVYLFFKCENNRNNLLRLFS